MSRNQSARSVKLISIISTIFFLASSLNAKEIELHLRWEELPASLSGQKVTIVQIDNKKAKGRLIRVEQDDLILQQRSRDRPIPRSAMQRIETTLRGRRARGRIIGTTVGAGVGVVALALALTFTHNENGANADKITGATAGLATATTLLGFLAGRESDTDRTVIYIVSK